MTIAPWKLPIRTLRWGRFATRSDWIVWIDWLVDFTRRIVYPNGQIASTSLLEDDQIESDDGARLTMNRSLVLREGPLGATALSGIPGVRDSFPARLLNVSERKWRSRARFERPGTLTVEGWAIHEGVEWPKSRSGRSSTAHCSSRCCRASWFCGLRPRAPTSRCLSMAALCRAISLRPAALA